ncbi:MAG: hypothetical protein ACI8TF_001505 [Paracoccaceae bacterium]|jgi:hypothetical protein
MMTHSLTSDYGTVKSRDNFVDSYKNWTVGGGEASANMTWFGACCDC